MINPDNLLYCYTRNKIEFVTPSYSVAYTRRDSDTAIYIIHKKQKLIYYDVDAKNIIAS